jgi:hypothetical protein
LDPPERLFSVEARRVHACLRDRTPNYILLVKALDRYAYHEKIVLCEVTMAMSDVLSRFMSVEYCLATGTMLSSRWPNNESLYDTNLGTLLLDVQSSFVAAMTRI